LNESVISNGVKYKNKKELLISFIAIKFLVPIVLTFVAQEEIDYGSAVSLRIVLILRLCQLVSKRITIMLDDDLVAKIIKIQSEQIKSTHSSVSFSHVINETLKK
jgi:hypothetical protein